MDSGVVTQIGGLLVILFMYHISEYLVHRHFHPTSTDSSSFLLTPQYAAAYSLGLLEYFIELSFFPSKSDLRSFFVELGLLFVVVGLYIRFAAIFTAAQAFTHLVVAYKKESHQLVTHGIYRLFRHPGYFGFFVFAVGTQIALKNPVAVIIFIIVLWRYFDDRIRVEERYLVEMFGDDYIKYREKTPTWIPYIK
jgi:protein-S-isoprenylcysteine O-methyltransferase